MKMRKSIIAAIFLLSAVMSYGAKRNGLFKGRRSLGISRIAMNRSAEIEDVQMLERLAQTGTGDGETTDETTQSSPEDPEKKTDESLSTKAHSFTNDTSGLAARARAAFDNVQSNATIEMILQGYQVDFPVVIANQEKYAIVIESIRIESKRSYATIFCRVGTEADQEENSNSTEEDALWFAGTNIEFTHDGGFTGDLSLYLLEDYTFNMGNDEESTEGESNGNASITLVSSGPRVTYVNFDCDGFHALHLEADVTFSEDFMVPVNAKGEDMPGQVTGSFAADLKDWSNWYAEVQGLPKFRFKKLEDFQAEITNLVIDHSSHFTPDYVQFPYDYAYVAGFAPDIEFEDGVPKDGFFDTYQNDFPPSGTESATLSGAYVDDGKNMRWPEWQGVYFQRIEVTFPQLFRGDDSEEMVSIVTDKMLIDKYGVTGQIWSDPQDYLIKDAALGDWKFSLQKFKLAFAFGDLDLAYFDGSVVLPIQGDDEEFTYRAQITRDKTDGVLDYLFAVGITEEMSFPLFGAGEVNLLEDSEIIFEVIDEKFRPSADLTGNMNITIGQGDAEDAKAEGNSSLGVEMDFSRLILRTGIKPYITLAENGEFRFSASAELGGFKIQLKNAGLVPDGDQLGLEASILVSLTGEEGGFAGECGFTIWGERKDNWIGWQLRERKPFQLNSIYLEVNKGNQFSIIGFIDLKNGHPIYGDGFIGGVSCTFSSLEIEVLAMFGKTNACDAPDAYSKVTIDYSEGSAKTDFDIQYDCDQQIRYWMVDASVKLPSGIPIFAGLEITGFTGGAKNHLNVVNSEELEGKDAKYFDRTGNLVSLDPEPANPDPEDLPVNHGKTAFLDNVPDAFSDKVSKSNLYIPDASRGLGIKIGVRLGLSGSDMMDGLVTFEIQFNSSGGVAFIELFGKVTIMPDEEMLGGDVDLSALEKLSSGKESLPKSADDDDEGEEKDESADPDIEQGEVSSLSADFRVKFDFENKLVEGGFNIYANLAIGDEVIIKGVGPNGRAGWMSFMIQNKRNWYIYVGRPADPCGVEILDIAKVETYFVAGTIGPEEGWIAPLPEEIAGNEEEAEEASNTDPTMMGAGSGFGFGARLTIQAGGEAEFAGYGIYGDFKLITGFDIALVKSTQALYCKDGVNDGEARGINNWYATGQIYAYIGINAGYISDGEKKEMLSASGYAFFVMQGPKPTYGRGEVHVEFDFKLFTFKSDMKGEFGDICYIEESRNKLQENIIMLNTITPKDDINVVHSVATSIDIKLEIGRGQEFELVNTNGGSTSNDRVRVSLLEKNISVFHDKNENRVQDGNDVSIPGTFKWLNNNVLRFYPESVYEDHAVITVVARAILEKKIGQNWAPWPDRYHELTSSFKVDEEGETIDVNSLGYSYPMANMTNVYIDEAQMGYINFLTRPNKPLEEEVDFAYAVEFRSEGQVVAVMNDLQVDPGDGNTYTFTLPTDRMKTSTRYTLSLIRRSTKNIPQYEEEKVVQGERQLADDPASLPNDKVLLSYNFTTSKYRTFAQKFSRLSNTPVKADASTKSFRIEYIAGGIGSSTNESEGFSGFELAKQDPLIRFEALSPESNLSESVHAAELERIYSNKAFVDKGRAYSVPEASFPPIDAVFVERSVTGSTSIVYELPYYYTLDIKNYINSITSVFERAVEAGKYPDGITFSAAQSYKYRMYYYLPGKAEPNSEITLDFNLEEDFTAPVKL